MRTWRTLRQMTLFHLRGMMRNKIALFFNLVLPLLLLALFGTMFGGFEPTSKVAVGLADMDRGPVAAAVRQALSASGLYEATAGETAELQRQVASGRLRAALVLPAGLSGPVAGGRGTGSIKIIYDPSSSASARALFGLQQLVAGVEVHLRGGAPLLVTEPEVIPQLIVSNAFDHLMPGQLTYMLLSAGLITVAIALAESRRDGSLRHLFSTPLSMGVWLTARIGANLLLACLQIVILFAAAMALFDVTLPANLGGTAVLLLLSTLATLGFGMLVGSMTGRAETAMTISLALFMALSFLGNAMMPLDGAPAVVQAISRFMPSSYMTHSLRLVMMQGKGLGDVIPDMIILAGCAAVTLGLAAWRMRRQFMAA